MPVVEMHILQSIEPLASLELINRRAVVDIQLISAQDGYRSHFLERKCNCISPAPINDHTVTVKSNLGILTQDLLALVQNNFGHLRAIPEGRLVFDLGNIQISEQPSFEMKPVSHTAKLSE